MFSEIKRIALYGKGSPRKRLIACLLHVLLWPILLVPRLFWPPYHRRRRRSLTVPGRILLIRIDGIGDLAMTSASFKALRARFPKANIDIVTSDSAKPIGDLLVAAGWIDSVSIIPLYHRRISQYTRLAHELRARQYDVAIDLRGDLRNILLMWLSGAPIRLGLPGSGLTYLLTDLVDLPEPHHQAVECAELVKRAGVPAVDSHPALPLRPGDLAAADAWLGEQGIDRGRPICAFHLGASIESRIWPVERFAEVARRLRESLDAQILVVGGPPEVELATRFEALVGASVIIASGKASVIQTAAILRHCAVLIGNDSSPAHLAAYVGSSVVDLFGPANPAHTRPLSGRATVLIPSHPCNPLCDKQCVTPQTWCMLDHSVDIVAAAAESLVRQHWKR